MTTPVEECAQLGAIIRRLRVSLGLTLRAAADMLRVPARDLEALEHGRSSAGRRWALLQARALGLRPREIRRALRTGWLQQIIPCRDGTRGRERRRPGPRAARKGGGA